MKELVLSVIQGDASQILETLQNISDAFDSLDKDEMNGKDINFEQFCELTDRDYDNYDEEDFEAYLKAICIRLSYLQGLKDGKGI